MAYILNKTNGSIVATVQDAALDNTTDLTFLGRNYAGYGELQNENFLKLLENFSNATAPTKPLEGQIWYDSLNNRLNVYDGFNWKSIANLDISVTDPTDTKGYVSGDLWYNNEAEQLYVFNGNNFVLVGPPSAADIIAAWRGSYEYNTSTVGVKQFNIKAVIGSDDTVVAIVSNATYEVSLSPTSDSYPVAGLTNRIVKGITLTGADAATGSSKLSGYYFWGTAAESLKSDYANYAANALGFSFTSTNSNQLFYVPFISTTSVSAQAFVDTSTSGIYYNPSTNILYGTASSSLYSDLAERYHADKTYEEGTVLVIGGSAEVTACDKDADIAVAGIVSKKPAYRMNESAGDDSSHPFIALKGRVPCCVIGTVMKGSLLVTSSTLGHGRAWRPGDDPNSVFARALQSKVDIAPGIIEVMVA